MNDFTINLISNPLYAIIAFLLLWKILVYLLINKYTLKPNTWIKFEYAWLGIGFLAVLTLIAENRLIIQNNNIDKYEIWIERDYKSIKGYAALSANCTKFNFIGTSGSEKTQLRQDKICEWTKEVWNYIDSLSHEGYPEIDNLPELAIENPDSSIVYPDIREEVISTNKHIAKRNKLMESVFRNEWDDFRRTFGIVFLIIAFSLRFTITSYKVKKEV